MTDLLKLNARPREATGKGPTGRLRRSGKIPGVVYGRGKETRVVEVDAEEVEQLFHDAATDNVFLELQIEGEDAFRSVLIKTIQHEILGDGIMHLDFHEVSLTETLRAKVAVEPVGEAPGVRTGGVLEQIMHEIEVECLPTALPSVIEVDISNLEIGDSVKVADLPATDGVVIVPDAALVVCHVAAPRVVEEEEEEEPSEEGEEAEGGEPEVVGRKAEGEEGSDEG